MTLLKTYIIPRILQWALVIFIGVTLTFLIPRLSPINPVDQAVGRLTAFQSLSPEGTVALRESLEDLYGLDGTLPEQYFNFWRRVLSGDLGPSFSSFPMSVNAMIANGIWWTIGLLGTATLISWVLGILFGTLGGYFPSRWWAKIMEGAVIVIYPIPYFIIAFTLLMLFTYFLPIFPLVGGASGTPSLSVGYIGSIFRHSFLPAVSVIIGATAFRFIMAKALTTREKTVTM